MPIDKMTHCMTLNDAWLRIKYIIVFISMCFLEYALFLDKTIQTLEAKNKNCILTSYHYIILVINLLIKVLLSIASDRSYYEAPPQIHTNEF